MGNQAPAVTTSHGSGTVHVTAGTAGASTTPFPTYHLRVISIQIEILN
jgi:hypothetical protein